MKLQLALDLVNIPEAIELVKDVEEYIDIVEIGTPIINLEGLKAVKAIKDEFPHLEVLADMKVIDAAAYEVSNAAKNGADLVTILAQADNPTIKAAVEEAKKQGKQIVVDMISVKDVKTRAKELDELGADYIAVHTGLDMQAEGQDSFEDLRSIKSVVKNAKTAIAGGIKLENLPGVIKAQPDLIIVGGGIAGQENKKEAAAKIRQLMNEGVNL